MVDYIKMTEQASELLKAPQPADETPSSLDDKLKKEALDLAAAQQRKEEQPSQPRCDILFHGATLLSFLIKHHGFVQNVAEL